MKKIKVLFDESGNVVIVLPDIIFKNKNNIDWDEVEKYLQRYVGKIVTVVETKERIHIGNTFPDEFKGSDYTKKMRGSNARAKANAAQGIKEMIMYASNRRISENRKEKHQKSAKGGWIYYSVKFAFPVFENEKKTEQYNIYSGCLVVNCAKNNQLYLYDLVDIKKEASTPFKTKELADR